MCASRRARCSNPTSPLPCRAGKLQPGLCQAWKHLEQQHIQPAQRRWFGTTENKGGRNIVVLSIGFGGIPGKPSGDGPDGHSLWPGFTNVPNEFIESYFPLRIERYETIADSGGAGLHRGGNGLSVVYCFLCDGEIGIHDERWLMYPWGVLGGETGLRSTKRLVRADGSQQWLPAKVEGIKVKEGDLLARRSS